MKRVLVIGANSAIAAAVARIYAQRADALFLVARDQDKLLRNVQDAEARAGRKVHWRILDLNQLELHSSLIDEVVSTLGGIDVVLVAHGELGDQHQAQDSTKLTMQLISTNLLSPVSLLTILANYFEKQGRGTIGVITSVAGVRGRKSNYVYGTAKGGLSIFLSGMRNRLYPLQVTVCDLRLGFVDTPMTAKFKKNALWAQPNAVARAIVAALDEGKDIAYVPWFWRWIMLAILSIPEKVFTRLEL